MRSGIPWIGLPCLIVAAALSACDGGQQATATPPPTDAPVLTASATVVPALSPTITAAIAPLATATGTSMPTATAPATLTPTATAPATLTPTATAPATPTPTATAPATPTPTATAPATPTPTATMTATPTPTATVTATPTPTATPPATPMPAQQLTDEQKQEIAALPWAKSDRWAIETLQRLAMDAPAGFEALVRWDGDTRRILDHYTSIAVRDEEAAMSILQMPFLEEIDSADQFAMDLLRQLAESDLDGLRALLADPSVHDGITDKQVPGVWLLYLGLKDAAAAAAMRALPWVQDTTTPSAERDVVIYRRHLDHLQSLVAIALNADQTFRALIGKSWIRDGRALLNAPWGPSGNGRSRYSILRILFGMSFGSDKETARVLRMPFLDTIGQGEWSSLIILQRLLGETAYGRGFHWLVSQPALKGRITDDQRATVALLGLEYRDPDAAAAMTALPWIQDGVASSEDEGVLVLRELALESVPTLRAVLGKNWTRDGLTYDEARVVNVLTSMSQRDENLGTVLDRATALHVIDMPFMDTIQDSDTAALLSLDQLSRRQDATGTVASCPSSPSEKHGWRVLGGMMGPVQ